MTHLKLNSLLPRATAAAAASITLTLATSAATIGGYAALTAAAPPPTAVVIPAAATTPQITKVVTFMVENHSLNQMRASMPFVYGLAQQYAYADDYTAITHPSLPNYVAIVSGSTQGIRDDRDPAYHRLGATTVFDQALARHKGAKTYADSMTRNCQIANSGQYVVRHNPWAYFVHSSTSCARNDVPISHLPTDVRAGTLPNIALVIPNLAHDAHSASLAAADAWLKQQIQMIQAGPDWRAGRLAVIVTADEDDKTSGNRVLTVVASRYQSHRVVHSALNHYSLTRFFDSVIGAPYLANAATAPSMRAAFGVATPYGVN